MRSPALLVASLLPGALAPVALHIHVATGEGLRLTVALLAVQAAIAAVALRRRPAVLLLLLAAACGLLAIRLLGPTMTLLLASAGSHAAIFTALSLGFAASLRRRGPEGEQDVVTAMARRIDPGWTPAMAGYTRAVTMAWAIFFALQVVVSAALFAFASPEAWSFFVNILDLPLVGAMFAAEWLLRHRRYPGRPHIGPLGVLAAMRGSTSRAAG